MIKLFLLVICTLFAFVTLTSAADSSDVSFPNDVTCTKRQWACSNGQCIHNHQICDGQADCQDKSDESALACFNFTCPAYSYRCTYGACVPGISECDGKIDCVDASDEHSPKCTNVKENTIRGNCKAGQAECKSLMCIGQDKVCDGMKDCDDGSDETSEKCTSAICPSFAKRCAYGACIDGEAWCNRAKDCVDNSDEDPKICNYSTSNTTSPESNIQEAEGCKITTIPKNAFVLRSADERQLFIGDVVGYYQTITFRCNTKHNLEGVNEALCSDNGWETSFPKCRKFCNKFELFNPTITSSCSNNNNVTISCHSNLKEGTKAHLSCAIGYAMPNRTDLQPLIICDSEGEWSHRPFRCVPECGTKNDASSPYVIGGETRNITKVPWHVALYKKKHERYDLICGGTILNAKLIISAAHCFEVASSGDIINYNIYSIAAGKYYSDYTQTEPLETQFFNISKIVIQQYYAKEEHFFSADIALIVLSSFILFRSHIKPICMEPKHPISSNYTDFVGEVAGWGYESEGSGTSSELKVATLNITDTVECRNKVRVENPEYSSYVLPDKFCARSDHSNVCNGDSGGGIVIEKESRYYLLGVVSNGQTKFKCTINQFTLFTKSYSYLPDIVYWSDITSPINSNF